MYVKNIYSHVPFVFMGNVTRLYPTSDTDNTVSDSVSDNGTNDNTDSEQNKNTSLSDSQEERTEEKESENTKKENISEDTEAEETQNTDNSEMSSEETTEAEETQSTDNSEMNTEENTEAKETQVIDDPEENTELTATTLSDSDADIVTLLQENNELLQKQYTVTASYLNLLTFTLLAIWVINSIHKSVTRMSRRKEK